MGKWNSFIKSVCDLMITIAMTLKNRAFFLEGKFENLLFQKGIDFNKIEISITDGYSDDNELLFKIIDKYYRCFDQIIFAESDRSVLPYQEKINNPAADINSQICNLTNNEKIIRTDAEVLFTDPHTILNICENLNEYHHLLIWHDCLVQMDKECYTYQPHSHANYCIAFNKSKYIENFGIDEKFCIGFAGEDTALIKSWKRKGFVLKSPHKVLHLWHDNPAYIIGNNELYKTYTKPLQKQIECGERIMNEDCPDWQRPEMIKNIKVFKK